MKKKLKRELLETLNYHLGIIKVLKRESKKQSKKTEYDNYLKECDKVKTLIEEIKLIDSID